MPIMLNKGYDQKTLKDYREKFKAAGQDYLISETDENNEECVHFYFIGKHDGKEVVCDTVMYTLRLHQESELFEIAEHKAAQHFPQYKKIRYNEDENGNLKPLDDLEEEIGLYMAEIIMELQEDEQAKVREHLEVDIHLDFGIGLNVGLNVEMITPQTIQKFIREFNEGTLVLDDTLYSFQTQGEESE